MKRAPFEQRWFLRRLDAPVTKQRKSEKLIHLPSEDGADDLVQYAYCER